MRKKSENALSQLYSLDAESVKCTITNVQTAARDQDCSGILKFASQALITIKDALVTVVDVRIHVLLKQGRFHEAIQDAQSMITHEPTLATGYLRLGDMYRMQGKQQSAIDTYDLGIQSASADHPHYSQMFDNRELAVGKSKARVDFVARLPIEIVDSIVVLLPAKEKPVYCSVSSTWCNNLAKLATEIQESMTIDDTSKGLSMCITPGVWNGVEDLTFKATNRHVLIRYMHSMSIGGFGKLKTLKLQENATKLIEANMLMMVSQALRTTSNTLTTLVVDFNKDSATIAITDILYACSNLTTLEYSTMAQLSNVIGSIIVFLEPHRALIDMKLKAMLITGQDLEKLLSRCYRLRRLVLFGCNTTVLEVVDTVCPSLETLGYNPQNVTVPKLDTSVFKPTSSGLCRFYTNNSCVREPISAVLPLLQRNMLSLKVLYLYLTAKDSPENLAASYEDLKLQNLESLTVWCDDTAVIQLLMLRSISTCTTLTYAEPVDSRDITALVNALVELPRLQFLHIAYTDTPTGEADIVRLLEAYTCDSRAEQRQLKTVWLRHCKVIMTDNVLAALACISTLENIELSGLPNISAHGINEFLRRLSNSVSTVKLAEIDTVTDGSLTVIGNNMKNRKTAVAFASTTIPKVQELPLLQVRDHRSYAFAVQRKFDQAVNDAQGMIACGRVLPTGYLRLGETYQIQGKQRSAKDTCDIGLHTELASFPIYNLDTDPVQHAFAKVGTAIDNRNYPLAVEFASKTLVLLQQMLELTVLDHRAHALGMQGQFEQAVKDARFVIACNPTLAAGYLRLGEIYQMQGKQMSAMDAYNRGLKHVSKDDPAYAQLLDGKESATKQSETRVDFVDMLPIEVVDNIISLVPNESKSTSLIVSSAWRNKVFNALPHIACHVEDLIIDSTDRRVLLRYLFGMNAGNFSKIKSLQLCENATKHINTIMVMSITNAFWHIHSSLTKLVLHLNENSAEIALLDLLSACSNLTTVEYSTTSQLSKVAGELIPANPSTGLVDMHLKATSITGQDMQKLLPHCQQLRRLILCGGDTTVLDIVDRMCPYRETFGFNPDVGEVQKLDHSDPKRVFPGLYRFYTKNGGLPESAPIFLPLIRRNMHALKTLYVNISAEDSPFNLTILYSNLKLGKLEKLTFWGDDTGIIQPLILRAISTCTMLTHTEAVVSRDIPGLVDVLMGLPQLEPFGLSHIGSTVGEANLIQLLEIIVTDNVLTALARIDSLEDITLEGLPSASALGMVEFFKKLSSRVSKAKIVEIDAITDSPLIAIGNNMKDLKMIYLGKLKKVSDDGIIQLTEQLPKLQSLTLASCKHVTQKAIAHAKKEVKNVVVTE
ncbi:hypothetical protein BJV82DRAFT_713554 [Fennellomyces sp. T-0311]|nr:hypothetical protein BJV82DRAFT_713554 [Fennellomyces sp. T-0311]